MTTIWNVFLSGNSRYCWSLMFRNALQGHGPAVLEQLTANTGILLEAAAELQIPVMITEQYVKGLGETVPELLAKPVKRPLREDELRLLRLHGFYGHTARHGTPPDHYHRHGDPCLCLASALELLDAGYTVHVVRDAVMSRARRNWQTALEIMQQAGGWRPAPKRCCFSG